MIKSETGANRKYTITSMVFLVLCMAFGAILYHLVMNSYKVTEVVVTKTNIKSGALISSDMLETRTIGRYGLPSNLAIQPEQVIGKYATRDMTAQEYVFGTSLTDNYLKRLSEKARYGAIAVPINVLDAVSGDIKENDFVGVLISMKKSDDGDYTEQNSSELPTTNTALIYSKELVAVRVLGIYDNSANVAGRRGIVTEEGEGTEFISPSMIVFDALPMQRILLNQARDNGSIRLIIQPEHIQEAYRKAWGLGYEEELDEDIKELDELLDKTNQIEQEHDNLSDNYGTLEEEGNITEELEKEFEE